MMGMSQLYQVERAKAIAEQRLADAWGGEIAAATSRSLQGASQRRRALANMRLHVRRAKHRATGPIRTYISSPDRI
jgi:hypothetical protein